MKVDEGEFDEPGPEVIEKPRPRRDTVKPGRNGDLPASREAEEFLLSCCLMDGPEVMPLCLAARFTPETFYYPTHQLVFERLSDLFSSGRPTTLDVVAESLRSRKQLEQVGGFAGLTEISSRIPTTAQAPFFVDQVRDYALRRRFNAVATQVLEAAHADKAPGGFAALLANATEEFARMAIGTAIASIKSIADFKVPRPGDRSILLGNRYLNRGDGAILSSTSGVGKSSIAVQMACCWALARQFLGMASNGPLSSLIIQAEDSEGDIGEVWASMVGKMNLSEAEIAQIRGRVTVVTNRTKRGPAFITWLRGLTAKHKPDLVFLNPLQAFLSGDITKGEDLGAFLREGLNSVNEANAFGFILIHHTTKPTADPKDRQWHEVMYDMAGGAELINWARAIISIRPREDYGKFSMVMAKRGSRAGITKEVAQGTGFRTEIVLTVPIKYSGGTVDANGLTIPAIYWEQDGEGATKIVSEKPAPERRGPDLSFAEFKSCVPVGRDKAVSYQVISRTGRNKGIGLSEAAFASAFKGWVASGVIAVDATKVNDPRYYLEG